MMANVDMATLLRSCMPRPEEILAGVKAQLPDRDRFQETISRSLTQAIQNSLPERTWLESISRGLFDDRTRGILPEKTEVVSLLREEIRMRLLDNIEKIVKSQLDQITSDLYSNLS